jgi:hypothetical protein
VHELDESGEMFSEAHVVISSDLQHDSEAVQHYFKCIQASYEKKVKIHWIDTDGAGSHFKNRFTFQAMCELKEAIEAAIMAWETCAPGHGKGAWDGLCAVIKSWLRRYEIRRKNEGARETFSPRGVFEVLCARQVDWVAQVRERTTLQKMTFWYVPTSGEDCVPGPNVLPPVPRARSRPSVSPVEGIRTHFFFVFVDATTLWMRKLSCHCEQCRLGEFKTCTHDSECGAWQVVKLFKTAASAPVTTRSLKTSLDAKRRDLARGTVVNQLIGQCFVPQLRGQCFVPGAWLDMISCCAST